MKEVEKWQDNIALDNGASKNNYQKLDVNKFRELVNPKNDEKDTNKNIQGIPKGDD